MRLKDKKTLARSIMDMEIRDVCKLTDDCPDDALFMTGRYIDQLSGLTTTQMHAVGMLLMRADNRIEALTRGLCD